MGLTTGEFPPVEPAKFMDMPYQERIKVLSRHWAEYGFGAPKITAIVYIVKLLVLYMGGGILVGALTSGLDPFSPSEWWDAPIFYQKVVLWTAFLEAMGLAGSWGPLAGHFKPMTGGVLYYARTGTIRNPPFPTKVPGTEGGTRTALDAGLFIALMAAYVVALAVPGTADGETGIDLLPVAAIIPILVLQPLLGLRDKIAFLQARSEQYLPALVFFAFFPFVDMIVAAKILIVTVWCGAAFSKFGHHFGNVIPPMVSNTPWLSSRKVKKMHYRNFPEDLRPSKAAVRIAHGPGTLVEFGTPLVLLFSGNETLSVAAAILMICFHVFITSTFPLAVPLEWNIGFIFITAFLFIGWPNHEGFGLGDMDTTLMILTFAACLFFPIVGNMRPDKVSFLPSMRQYAGNWASAMWAFAPGAEKKLDDHLVKPALMQRQQLVPLYGDDEAEVIMQQLIGWRAMHSQGRGMNSVMIKTLGADMDHYIPREAEFSCNAITGFNFGDGHFHDEHFLRTVQEKCNFAPGEFMVVWVESERVGEDKQYYFVMDVAVGVVERGYWKVTEAVAEQPWLPNGPIDTTVTWKLDGYERVRYPAQPRPVPAAGDDADTPALPV
ncbi:DUF3556 domain-containing protein [Conexibacter sp. W3-3-2]|uniref:DUF3556 domain-containing protein n=1 Tax=Conexibacter sp. W3-3-2 TaxID=2675227 RepID=UPI0012B8D7BC|nr:DUF3556 domain-containing protein [Conexibacter sp. W3-3-2]MTD43824.1 DUF3556 domain-containing protein [Conexibacter sp. W3-3-2]